MCYSREELDDLLRQCSRFTRASARRDLDVRGSASTLCSTRRDHICRSPRGSARRRRHRVDGGGCASSASAAPLLGSLGTSCATVVDQAKSSRRGGARARNPARGGARLLAWCEAIVSSSKSPTTARIDFTPSRRGARACFDRATRRPRGACSRGFSTPTRVSEQSGRRRGPRGRAVRVRTPRRPPSRSRASSSTTRFVSRAARGRPPNARATSARPAESRERRVFDRRSGLLAPSTRVSRN